MKIAILDDHTLLLQGLFEQLKDSPGVTFVDCFSEADKFLKATATVDYDVILLDIFIGKVNGFDVLKKFRKNNPHVRVIMISGEASVFNLNKAIQEGANGLIRKDCDLDELLFAIDPHEPAEFYIGKSLREFAGNLLTLKKNYLLSEREIEVIALIAKGKGYKEIGTELNISSRTVESHRNKILEKLEISNVAELIVFAIKNRLI